MGFDVRSRITEYTPYIIVSLQESDRERSAESNPRKLALARTWHRGCTEHHGPHGVVKQVSADECCGRCLGEKSVLFAQGPECVVRRSHLAGRAAREFDQRPRSTQ